jgi:hypothetical protein
MNWPILTKLMCHSDVPIWRSWVIWGRKELANQSRSRKMCTILHLNLISSLISLFWKKISTAYFINPSHQSVCLMCIPPIVARQRLGKVYPSFIARQWLGKRVPAETKHFWRGRFYAVRDSSKECRRIVLPRTYCVMLFMAYLRTSAVFHNIQRL